VSPVDVVVGLLPWTLLLALALADRVVRRTRGLDRPQPPGGTPPRWAFGALVAAAVLVAAVRAPLAAGREVRNVDEYQYAAAAAYGDGPGRAVFDQAFGVRLPVLFYGLGEWPLATVDLLVSVAVGLTGLLLGLALLRALGRPAPAVLAPVVYFLATLRFEGLSSNTELWVAPCLAGWVLLRLGRPEAEADPGPGRLRRVGAGACLGLAFLMKEQAAPFVLLEPAVELLALRGAPPGGRVRAFAGRMALAAAGWWLAVAPWLLAFAARGTLGAYLADTFGWAGTQRLHADPSEPGGGAVAFAVELLAGEGVLVLTAAGLLGLGFALRTALEPDVAGAPGRRLPAGLAVGVAAAMLALAWSLHWFGHYYLLATPFLAGLAALRLEALARELRAGERAVKVLAGVTLALALACGVFEARVVWFQPSYATGASMPPAGWREAAAAARLAADATAPDEPILVWGWRHELYYLARRRPATPHHADVLRLAHLDRLLEALDEDPPGAVVLPGPHGLGVGERDPFALADHPAVRDWLVRRGYRRAGSVRGFVVLTPP